MARYAYVPDFLSSPVRIALEDPFGPGAHFNSSGVSLAISNVPLYPKAAVIKVVSAAMHAIRQIRVFILSSVWFEVNVK